jgi:hypothetical protein
VAATNICEPIDVACGAQKDKTILVVLKSVQPHFCKIISATFRRAAFHFATHLIDRRASSASKKLSEAQQLSLLTVTRTNQQAGSSQMETGRNKL